MPLAKLPGEAEGASGRQGTEASLGVTLAADGSDVGYLLRQRKEKNVGYLIILSDRGGEERHVLDKANYTVGRGRNCNLRIPGWFAPKVAVTLQQRNKGHYLIPGKRARVEVNSQTVTESLKLEDEDFVNLGNLSFRFYFRPIK